MASLVIPCSLLIVLPIIETNCLVIEAANANPNGGIFSGNLSRVNGETRDFEISYDSGPSNSDALNFDKLVDDIWKATSLVDLSRRMLHRADGALRVSRKCHDDVSRYVTGLESSATWALKMSDASGRRTSGLFSGNKYWIGGSDQCREMENDFVAMSEFPRSENDQKPEKPEKPEKPDVPPFRVSLNSVRLVLDVHHPGINGSYDITMGVCVPSSCRSNDVAELLHYFSNKSRCLDERGSRISIERVRNLSEGYSLWEDPIVYVLLISLALASLLVTVGTLYDAALRYRVLGVLGDLEQEREIEAMSGSREEAATSRSIKMTKITENKTVEGAAEEDFIHRETTISRFCSIKQPDASHPADVWNAREVPGGSSTPSTPSTSSQPFVPPRPMSEALLSFSLLLNVSKLASLDVGSDTLAPIHGLRFISILWIVMVHTCLMVNQVSENKIFRSKAEEDFLYQTISNGTYAVDTFFFISGCLVSFLYFRTISKEMMKERKLTRGFCGKIVQFFGMMSYRYFRLTPPYLLVIGIVQISTKWYHDHSIIELTTLDHRTCQRFWWRNALYVNTYFPMEDRCMVWSWYLANDTQFFTLGIIILITAASSVSFGAAIGTTLLIASWITTAVVTVNTKHVPTIREPFAHYESLYDKPWMRIGPYLIGMAAGWYLFKIDRRLKLGKTLAFGGWISSIATLLTVVYGLYGDHLPPLSSVLYTTLSHSGWAISVGFILIACVTGNGGVVDKILSWKYLYPLSRLTYCVYLIHPALLRAFILGGESSFRLTQGFVAIIFLGITVASYAISLFLSLLFEAPMVSLLRIVHPLRRWKQH